MEKSGIRKGAFRAVRSANQTFALKTPLSFNDIKHVATDLAELVRRFNRLRARSDKFKDIELSPYIGRMVKIMGAEKLIEEMSSNQASA